MNKKLTIRYLAKHLNIKFSTLHKQLFKLFVIFKPLGQDTYVLTDLALAFGLGEIRITTVQSGYKKQYIVYNVDMINTLLQYDMTLYQLYEAMYPEDSEHEAPREDEGPLDGYWQGWRERHIKSHRSR